MDAERLVDGDDLRLRPRKRELEDVCGSRKEVGCSKKAALTADRPSAPSAMDVVDDAMDVDDADEQPAAKGVAAADHIAASSTADSAERRCNCATAHTKQLCALSGESFDACIPTVRLERRSI